MASFATPAELATYLRTATEAEATAGNPDVLDTTVAQLLLDTATASIQDVCGWTISQETVTVEPADWTTGAVFLPTLRLTALSVTYNGVPSTVGYDFSWKPNGTVSLFRRISTPTYATVSFTYTHGYSPVPASVKTICLEQAAIAYPNPSRYLSENIDGVITQYARGALDQDPRLARYIRRSV